MAFRVFIPRSLHIQLNFQIFVLNSMIIGSCVVNARINADADRVNNAVEEFDLIDFSYQGLR